MSVNFECLLGRIGKKIVQTLLLVLNYSSFEFINLFDNQNLIIFITFSNKPKQTEDELAKIYNQKMLDKFLKADPRFRSIFSFKQFNQVQKACFPKIMDSSDNMIVSAPTSAGKTVLFELAIVKMIKNDENKCLYLAPIKSLCHQKANSWKQKFMSKLHVLQLTGDSLQMESDQLDNSNLIIATPQKIDYLSRQNLDALRSLSLLLIDQIHMLNMEQRGATLEAIVSRIMSINPKIRIIAVSATIPNIQQVGQWLKVPKTLICVFGQQFRPAKLNKVVLGFKSNGNDFNFQKMLNFKILEIIRHYSFGGGTLVFCQTQKGTQEACQKIISQMGQRQFLQNDSQLLSLVQASKTVDNATLKTMLPQGVAFHNAGLSMKDRSIVQKLFLQFKIKVLCTTSTLAMGINLPARLVIIKSTKCYRGSSKGYQQYTQIQMDQMMGRAGRVPYDTQGTVVIMTQKNNYNKYLGKNKLQNLESQLYNQLIEHLNTQISLQSIQSLGQACNYIQNSFFYIRMMNSPKQYGLNSNKEAKQFIKKTSRQLILKLSSYQIITFSEQSQKLFPKLLSINLSKNAIEINTMIKIIDSMSQIVTQRQFLMNICASNQLSKFRSKLDQRKILKDLNQKNKYTLKQAISNHQRKCFVLVQSELSGIFIQNWEMRRQARQIIYFLKRLVYCVKNMAYQKRNTNPSFWIFCFSQLFFKYLTLRFWDQNNQQILKQFTNVSSKWKVFQAKGITNVEQLKANIDKIDSFCQKSSIFSKQISYQLKCVTECVEIKLEKLKINHQNLNKNLKNNENTIGLKICYQNKNQKIKNISISVEFKDQIYLQKIINQQYPDFYVVLRDFTFRKYFISIIKQGIIGFDEFYWCQNGKLVKTHFKKQQKQQHIVNKAKRQSLQINRKSDNRSPNQQLGKKNKRSSQSLQISNKKLKQKKYNRQVKKPVQVKQINYYKSIQTTRQSSPLKLKTGRQDDQQEKIQNSSTVKRTKQLKITDSFDTVKFKIGPRIGEYQQQERNNYLQKKIKNPKQQNFRDLKKYKWKAGFQPILDDDEQNLKEKSPQNNNNRTLLISQNDNQPSTFYDQPVQPDIKSRLNIFMNKNGLKQNNQNVLSKNNRFENYPKIIKYKKDFDPTRSQSSSFEQPQIQNSVNVRNNFGNQQQVYNNNRLYQNQSFKNRHPNHLFYNRNPDQFFHNQNTNHIKKTDKKQQAGFRETQHEDLYEYFNNLF